MGVRGDSVLLATFSLGILSGVIFSGGGGLCPGGEGIMSVPHHRTPTYLNSYEANTCTRVISLIWSIYISGVIE